MRDNLLARSFGFQGVCFAILAATCLALLEIYSGSDHLAYQAFETAVTRLYWAFIPPLAALFDRVWKMFETRGQLREQMKEVGREEGRKEGRKEGREVGREEEREKLRVEFPEEERAAFREWQRERAASQSNGASQQWQAQLLEEIRGLRLDLQRHQIRQEGYDEGERRATQRIIDVLKQRGIDIPPEIAPDANDAS